MVLKLHQQLQIIIKVEEEVELLLQELQDLFLVQLVLVEQVLQIVFQVVQYFIQVEEEVDLTYLVLLVELEEQVVEEQERLDQVDQQELQEQLTQVVEVVEQEMVLHQDQAVQESLS
jgi:hypothetical protein